MAESSATACRETPRLVFGNFVNELMVAVPDRRHAAALVAVSPRKVWLTQPGDVLVLPSPVPQAFWAYAVDLLGMSAGDVEVIDVDTSVLEPLALRVRSTGRLAAVRDAVAARPGVQGLPFALDAPTLELFAELGLPVEGYADLAMARAGSDVAYRVNTKSGFHALATELGIPTVPSQVVGDRAGLLRAVRGLLSGNRGAVVKLDRSSNGFALLFLTPADALELEARVDAHLAGLSGQPQRFVVQPFLDVDEVLTVEMWAHESGPEVVHLGQMITPNGSFTGQITPPPRPSPALDELARHGLTWGARLHADMYRGPFDLDAVLVDEQLLITESNVRRTGTTYIEHMVQRFGAPYGSMTWIADSRVGRKELSFDQAVSALRAEALAYADGVGVILTADTRGFDGKWRYLVLGPDQDRVEGLHKQLCDVLRLA